MHTKGPWIARQQTNARTGRNMGWIIETENGSRIGWSDYADAVTNKGDQPPYEQSGENAQVIAAAPDLLDACREAMGMIEAIPDGELTEQDSLIYGILQHAACKAEGSDTNA